MSLEERIEKSPAERVLRFEVASREALERLATGELPGGMQGGAVALDFYREIFFDTAGGDLERRGISARLCLEKDGSRRFSVDVRERTAAAAQFARTHAEALVPDEEIEKTFAGPSEPARMLRAMTDPARLSVQLEMEVMRRVRMVHLPREPDVEFRMALDAVTLRLGEFATEFYELELACSESEVDHLDAAVRALDQVSEVHVTLASKLARAKDLLEQLELEAWSNELQNARAVAVIAHYEGEIALRRDGESLSLPLGSGWGEQACRHVLRTTFGNSQGQLRLLGSSAGVGTRPALQVWLAERVHAEPDGDHDVEWLPLEDVLQRAGSPELRNAPTLAALHFAARQQLPRDPLATGAHAPSRRALFRPQVESRTGRPGTVPLGPHGAAKRTAPPPESLINMELSELAFQERVLALAEDERNPLLERVRFLSILGSNLDEFFMTRVAGFHQQAASRSRKRTLDGMTPEEQLDAIGIRVRELYGRAYRFLWEDLIPALQQNGVQLLSWGELDDSDRRYLTEHYGAQLGAVLTPLAADPSHPFPHIRNLRPALGVSIRFPEAGTQHFAAIELPGDLPRFVPLPGGRRFVPLEEVITASLPRLYQGLEVVAAHAFRVTRSANFSIDEEEVSDLLQAVEEKVQQRPLGPVVRLEVEQGMPEEMRELLLRELQFESRDRVSTLREEDVYLVDRLVDLFALREIASLPLDEYHYPPLQRRSPLDSGRSVWPVLRERDLLIYFPFDSFEATVERVLAEAVQDDRVVSIKITLYRTNRSSRVVKLLRRARRKGKEVVALVELKASFDERRNIEWARALESAGIHVVYGPLNLKVHAKILLIVRREPQGLQRYMYIGTGNLNAATAASYTDLGLLTTSPELGDELNDVFNGLTGYSVRTEYEHLLVAPFNMRSRFLELIGREVEHARAGRGGHLRVKLNGLTDPELIAALYRASQAGVRIELIIRGLCSLRPGVPGLSENIRVISLLGRFLEHARIYRFENAGSPEHFIGSADWRPRNLSRRVEVVTPVRDRSLCARLDEILEENLNSPEAWELYPDGSYERVASALSESSP